MPTAFITVITGQDGSFLAEQLVEEGWRVVGLVRRSASRNLWRLSSIRDRIELVDGDLLDLGSMIDALRACMPDHVYNLAAQSFVGVSFEQPITTTEITGLGTLNILEAIRIVDKSIRFYQASTSEMFGKVLETPQNEKTPFYQLSLIHISEPTRPY